MAIHTPPLIENSHVLHAGTHYALTAGEIGSRNLLVQGDLSGFEGQPYAESGALLCPLTAHNAAVLRQRLPWLNPVPLGLRVSAGFGDRLGTATPGHLMSIAGTAVAPILAQQSVRENSRTGRTPQQVLDDAMWGVFYYGWRGDWGADADHLKTLEAIPPFTDAGYSFYTIDPGDYVDDHAAEYDLETLHQKAAQLDWATLATSQQDLIARLSAVHQLGGLTLNLTEEALLRSAVKYGAAVAHAARMSARIHELLRGLSFDLEVSVDETGSTTSAVDHFYIVSELKRLGVAFVSIAPRFVGSFEKGVDYIGDWDELDVDIAAHASIMQHFGNSYKLSLHTGSDKFGVYPIALRHTGGLVHLKTAGTSYLEALRLMTVVDPVLFRRILDFARARYTEDRRTYHVSAVLDQVPASSALRDEQLPDLLNHFHSRQVLHVTFGSVLDTFGGELAEQIRRHEAQYHAGLKAHFDRHLEAFPRSAAG